MLITVLEGLLHLNQYHQNWINYRNVPDPHALLAERIESLVSQEHAKWASIEQQEPGKQQRR